MSDLKHCYLLIQGHRVRIDEEDLARVTRLKWRITTGASGRIRVVTSKRTPKGVRSQTLGKFLMNPPLGKQVLTHKLFHTEFSELI